MQQTTFSIGCGLWTYQPPHTPTSDGRQRYYRQQKLDPGFVLPTVSLLRFSGKEAAKLTLRIDVEHGCAETTVELPRANLLLLRDALNDALHEMQIEDAERERMASFQAICDEINAAEAEGRTSGVHYIHPDVFYVAPGNEDELTAQLQAAGAPRYLVLPCSTGGATPAEETAPAGWAGLSPFPERPATWPEGCTHLVAA